MPTHSRGPTPEQIAEELDGFIKTRDVERATGYTRRWISELIARGPLSTAGHAGSVGLCASVAQINNPTIS